MLKRIFTALSGDLREFGISKASRPLYIVYKLKKAIGLSDVEAICIVLLFEKYPPKIISKGKKLQLVFADDSLEIVEKLKSVQQRTALGIILKLYGIRFNSIDVHPYHYECSKGPSIPLSIEMNQITDIYFDFERDMNKYDRRRDEATVYLRILFNKGLPRCHYSN